MLGCEPSYLIAGDERFENGVLKEAIEQKEEKTMANEKNALSVKENSVDEKAADKPFGKKLGDLRTEKGLTLNQVAEAAGIKSGAYKGMEYKNSRPRDIKIYDKLAEVLGCDVSYLAAGDERFGSQKDASAAQVSTEESVVKEENAVAAEKKASDKKAKSADEKQAPAEEQKAAAKEEKAAPAEEQKPAPSVPVSEPLGKRLGALRKEKGLTLAQIAEKVGISVETYKGMEYRNSRPRDEKVYNKLAKALGCDVGYLKEGDKKFAAPKKAASKKKGSVISAKKPAPTGENISTEEPIQDLGEIEKNIPKAPVEAPVKNENESPSAEAIKLVSRLSVLLAGDKISKSEKDAIMISLNGAYWK